MNNETRKSIENQIKILKLRIKIRENYCCKIDKKIEKLIKKTDNLKWLVSFNRRVVEDYNEDLLKLESIIGGNL